jgi:OOP family OmpA-OmpF porin
MSLPLGIGRGLVLAAALAAPLGWAADAAPEPPAEIALALGADGALRASGRLPRGLAPEALRAALPGVDVSALDRTGTAPAWQVGPALDALSIVLPRFRTAEVRLGENRLAMEGTLRSGLSAAGAQAALRAALGTAWLLDLRLTETAPAAEIVVVKTDQGLAVSGLLPGGFSPPEALALLGEAAGDFGLAGGGEGSARAWPGALAALGETLDLFATATGRVAEGEVAIEGVLRPGYPAGLTADRLGARLPAGWQATLDAAETPPGEGDRRISLETGQPESFRRGYWLPEVAFPVSTARCRAEADAGLAGEGLPFADGAAEIEPRGLALLNRLAAIAVRCLNSSPLRLEIAGHMDAAGNDAANAALSEARAETVRQALVDRGVRAESVTARGYGESRPIATNNTSDGRAQNRRIAFQWSGPEG